MGACCSCHTGYRGHRSHRGHRGQRFSSEFVDEEDVVRQRDRDDYRSSVAAADDDIVNVGDHGAHIRLQGSSKYVSMFSQQGKKGVNQDAMTVWENFNGARDMFFCGVFDGHGSNGHKVAQYIRDRLPSKISKSNVDADDAEESPFFSSWKPRILESFAVMDEELEGDAEIESYCSGTTSVSVLKQGEHLIVANLGDSRAVLGTRDDRDNLVAEQITVDLKPNVPGELERIESCQGRVMAMEKDPGVYRIWMPDEDCPGLAMARAFGDFCLKDFGVISTPELFYRKLTSKDEFIVLATDGIWDVLSNQEVVAVVESAKHRSTAAKMVVERAVKTWKYKYPLAKTDDIAVICLFFKRQKPRLTKSFSEKTQLSLNYSELELAPSSREDDGLDTVLNCIPEESPENDEGSGRGGDHSRRHRARNRRRSTKRYEYVES